MTEARKVEAETQLDAAELDWLEARLEEYRDLLVYLGEH